MKFENLAKRVLVSAVAIPLILYICYIGGIYFFAFTSLIGLMSFYEFSGFVKAKNISVNLWIGLPATLLIIANRYAAFIDFYLFTIFIVVLLTLTELFRNKESAINNLGSTLLGIFYIGLFASSLIDLRGFYPDVGDLYNRGGFIIIALLASIWICDSAAYFFGLKFGKHKLFQRVSPKKSWEGAVFGFIFALLTMILAKVIILDFLSWQDAIALGVIVGIIGQIGDLIESLFKRDSDTKDSSNIIPGHGGVFDRFDSLLYSAPVVLIYLTFSR